MKIDKIIRKLSIIGFIVCNTGLSVLISSGLTQPVSSLLSIDYKSLISRADIIYNRPINRAEAGLPIGNGRMGSLIWTTDNSINFQINRVDVFAQNSYSTSGTDYCCGCGNVTIKFDSPVFKNTRTFKQHVSVFDGLVTILSDQVKAEVLAGMTDDVMVIRISNQLITTVPIAVELRMLRPPFVKTRNHTAVSTMCKKNNNAILTQEFSEADYFCRSMVGVGVSDKENSIEPVNDKTMRLIVEAGSEPITIMIASAATFYQSENLTDKVMNILGMTSSHGFSGTFSSNQTWWNDFWKKSFLHLNSEDGSADFLEKIHTYHLYLMASTSRGKFPPKFNGMLWNTAGDERTWGSCFWLWNQETMYFPLLSANHAELTDPHFDMYSGMLTNSAIASIQRWGSKGIYIQETGEFNGPQVLPESIAQTFKAILFGELPYENMPEEFRQYGLSHNGFSQLGNIFHSKKRYAWVAQIVSSAAELALQYYQRYQMTGDREWLETRAYPFLKGAMEFYRNFPGIKKESDGKYHIYNTNVHEAIWGAKDGIMDLAAIRGVAPLAINSSKLLGVDEDLRKKWQEFLDNLTPYPMSDEPDTIADLIPGTWAGCRQPTATGIVNVEQIWLTPIYPFEDWTLESKNETINKIAQLTYENLPTRKQLFEGKGAPVWSRMVIFAARIGRADEVEKLLPLFLTSMPSGVGDANKNQLPNCLGLWEGKQTMCSEHTGLVSCALQEAQLQSLSPRPGEPPIIHVYPAWPKKWDSQFSLRARGGFMVTSECKKGAIRFVEITSLIGNNCKLRNPWNTDVDMYRDGKKSKIVSGDVFEFSTSKGEKIIFVPKGVNPMDYKTTISPPVGNGIWQLKTTTAGKEFQTIIGLP